ncbi:transporter substrate-binding domain-containing protein [Ureibacillus composti]|nr:transporter substrate-binding domain-containing protein [Ureibacillus composti]
MKFNKLLKFAAVGFASISILAACGGNEEDTSTSEPADNKDAASGEVQKIKVAYAIGTKPITYQDENGEAQGYDVDAMRAVDEKLEDYEFEFVGTTDDDLLLGVEQGKYDVGIKNVWYTDERAQKYIFPKEFLGLSSVGLLLKKEDENIKDLSDFASANLELAPIAANNAQYTIVDEYNKANPDNKVKLVAGDEFTVDQVQWVNEGRSDGAIYLEGQYNAQILAENGPYHGFIDDVVYNEFMVVKTWPLFNKKQQEFADAYDEAMAEIKQTEELKELMKKHYGRDLFEVLEKVER